MSYPCTMCGCCCKRVNKAALAFSFLMEDELVFPYSWDKNGKCDMLMADNKCAVYDNRPLMCDVDKLMLYFSLPKKDFYEENIKACNEMMNEDGIDTKFNITLSI